MLKEHTVITLYPEDTLDLSPGPRARQTPSPILPQSY